jgi:hypothetical protein
MGVGITVLAALLGVVLATAAVWTNTFGAGDRFDRLMDRIELAIDPPSDREGLPTVQVTEPPTTPEPRTAAGTAAPQNRDPEATLRPPRKPVNFRIRTNPDRMFISQQTHTMCASAGIQMALAIQGLGNNKPQLQFEIHDRLEEWETRRDATAGGWGPAAMAEAMAAYGAPGYEVRAYNGRNQALRDAAIAIRTTRRPAILIAWRGAHTWVMTGYRADADPTVYGDAVITGAYIYDPWYPTVSTIWGPSDPPGTFQDQAEMQRNFLEWKRPEGPYPERDGKYITVVPTTTLAQA